MTSRARRIRIGEQTEAKFWKGRVEALLDIVNAMCRAHGSGDQFRVAVADAHYMGKIRRNVAVERLPDRIIVYLEPEPAPVQPKEDNHDQRTSRRDH